MARTARSENILLAINRRPTMNAMLENIWSEMMALIQAGHGDKAFEKYKEAIAIARATK